MAELERQNTEYERLIIELRSKITDESTAVQKLTSEISTQTYSVQEKQEEIYKANSQFTSLQQQQALLGLVFSFSFFFISLHYFS